MVEKSDSVVGIFGVPRSGTSWLGQIFNSSPHVAYRFQPLFSYTFKGRLSEHSKTREIENFYQELLLTHDDFILQDKNANNKKNPFFEKQEIGHLVWKEVRYHYVIENLLKNSDTKIIGLVRHPCAVISSWANAPKEFNSEWDILEEWFFAKNKNLDKKEEYNGYNKWKEIAFAFINFQERFSDQFQLIKYEDLNDQTEVVVRKLFDFCNIEWQSQTDQFIKNSKSITDNDPYGIFRKNQTNNEWENKLPMAIQQVILNDPDFISLNNFFKWNI